MISMACNDMLDLNPISEIGEESFYKNSDEINKAVIGCYNGLQDPILYEWAVTELRTDDSQMSLESSTAVYPEYRELDTYTETSQNSVVESYWEACYHDIALGNQVLAEIEVVDDEALKVQYASECRFMRAYHYFNLVRLFGPVVLVDEPISGDQAKTMYRSPVDSIYQFLETELSAAADGLPDSYSSSELGRVTSWAAKGLLAKVYLTESKYSQASSLLSEIMSTSPYSLLPDYADVFSTDNEMNDEILFAVRFMSGNVGLGSPFANWFAPLTSGSNVVNGDGRGWNYPTASLMSAYDDGDTRKDVCLQENYINQDNGAVVDRAYVNKYMYDVVDLYDAGNDWPVMRYADILLMYSEALNELNGVSDALPYLNQIRERAGLDDYTEADITNKYQFRIALENERRKEFAFENHRYFDLLRTDRLVDVINEHFATEAYYNDSSHPEFGADPIDEWQTLLPIPQREIDVNSTLTQNVGY